MLPANVLGTGITFLLTVCGRDEQNRRHETLQWMKDCH